MRPVRAAVTARPGWPRRCRKRSPACAGDDARRYGAWRQLCAANLGPDGNLRVANATALRWLGLTASVEGQVLWTLEGTEPLRSVARECLHADARCDASLVGPGAPGAAVRVTAVPLRSAGGDPEGVLYLVDVERVS